MSVRGPHLSRPAVPPLRAMPTEALDSLYLVGEGPAMRRVRSQLQRIAPYFRMALVTGEEGTGKETVARVLHAQSPGADGPFVAWAAAQFAEKLSGESQGTGLLQEAHRGTLFLGEIAAVPLSLQGSLARLLQQQENRLQRCDVRIVVASTRELRTLTTTGQFREDLYRQVATVDIGLCALRKRQEDIPALVQALLGSISDVGKSDAGTVAGISPEAMGQLEGYEWPGNVRELRRVLDAAVALAAGSTVEARHLSLPEPGTEPAPEQSLERLQDVVQRHVLEVLTKCAGNKLRASEVLGISRSTLYRMLDACGNGGDVRYPG